VRKTNKTQDGRVTYWVEHTDPEERGNSWSVAGRGVFQFSHEDGTTFSASTVSKLAYGKTEAHAIKGLERRFLKSLTRVAALINGAQEQTGETT